MSPEEKAKDLVGKFTKVLEIKDMRSGVNPYAKACAIICCDEILKESYELTGWGNKGQAEYWEQIKESINNL